MPKVGSDHKKAARKRLFESMGIGVSLSADQRSDRGRRVTMFRPIALVFVLATVGGCVTNISGKSAEKCATVADTPDVYAECVRGTTAEMQAKNRNTARILAAGLGGAAQTPQNQAYRPPRPTGYLQRSYVSGFNKICVYNELGSERAVTIASTQMCPLSH